MTNPHRQPTDERLGEYPDGTWKCICGNEASSYGFEPISSTGYLLEDVGDPETSLWLCDKCQALYNPDGTVHFKVGDKVRFTGDTVVERTEFGTGETGRIVEWTKDMVRVLLDNHFDILDEWDNCFVWGPYEDLVQWKDHPDYGYRDLDARLYAFTIMEKDTPSCPVGHSPCDHYPTGCKACYES